MKTRNNILHTSITTLTAWKHLLTLWQQHENNIFHTSITESTAWKHLLTPQQQHGNKKQHLLLYINYNISSIETKNNIFHTTSTAWKKETTSFTHQLHNSIAVNSIETSFTHQHSVQHDIFSTTTTVLTPQNNIFFSHHALQSTTWKQVSHINTACKH